VPDSRSGLAGFDYKNGDEVVSVVRIGLPEMAAVKNAVPVLIGTMTQAMMSNAMGAPPAPAPAPESGTNSATPAPPAKAPPPAQ
jgi:hypothetical protein